MSYVLGYFVADGCIHIDKKRKNKSFIFNITSVNLRHLYKIRKILGSNHKISKKFGSNIYKTGYQIQIRNSVLAKDLINIGVFPRKTYNLKPIKVPKKYFSSFVRGFFDGDGTVYIYKVNRVWQLKSGFVCSSLPFLKNLNKHLCDSLDIPVKAIHKYFAKNTTQNLYSLCFYINDSERLSEFMYKNAKIYLERKKRVFDKWKLIKRRHYIKQNYPSKIGWHLNNKIESC